jgi:uncharacterized repeat protein (TIGR02543 family)
MIAEGHDVDNHSFDHASFGMNQNDDSDPWCAPPNRCVPWVTTAPEARSNLQRASQAIFDVTGYWPFSFRAPFFEWGGGSGILNGLDRILNMAFIDSGNDPDDFRHQATGTGRNTIANWITGRSDVQLEGGNILMHDCGGPRGETVASLRIFIPALKARGFQIVTVRELYMITGATPTILSGPNMWPRVNQNVLRTGMWEPFPADLWSAGWHNNREQWTCITPPWDRPANGSCPEPRPTSVTITFNSQGGSTVAPITGHTTGAAVPVNQRPANPTRDGHAFLGWFTAATGGELFDFSAPVRQNVTLFARWISTANSQEIIAEWIDWLPTMDNFGGSAIDTVSRVPLVATLTTGPQNADPQWAWIALSAHFASGHFNTLESVRITYTASAPVRLGIQSTTIVGTANAEYFVHLPSSQTPNTLVFRTSDFRAPEWMYTPDWGGIAGLPETLDLVPAAQRNSRIAFSHESYGNTANISVSSLMLVGVSGGSTSIAQQGRSAARVGSVRFAGIRNGQINLDLQAGNYTAQLFNPQGRMVGSSNINAINGVNASGIRTDNLGNGIFILQVKNAQGAQVLQHRLMLGR